jgi:uncharacterized protein
MRKKSMLMVFCVAMLALVLALTGCGGNNAGPTPEPPGEQIEYVTPTSMVIGGASIGGTYYLYGQAWANVTADATGIPTSVEVTDGPNHNMINIQDGEFELGMVTMGVAYEGWNGLEAWTGGIKHTDIRALFPMYNTYVHWIVDTASGIESIRDMEGKRVGMGPAAGTIGTFGPRFFAELGITYINSHGGISELMDSQQDGMLDANGFAAGIPVSAFKQYEVTKGAANVRIIGIEAADRDILKAAYPFFSDTVIPASKYDSLTEDLETLGVYNVAIGHKTLHPDVVYEMVKAVMENNAAMMAGHVSAEETVPENFKYMDIIPLHPGAIRYFEEKGYTIPANLIPPEGK